ncbi:hypothetical protein Lalb_Chr02g0156191 [Lupinus albus]|uniref:Uncharacterized protein n=1 Tax=Lupinus albus TaxID=3870 RepID=A0A6A4R1W5_LUPAL|nr:hypothetical protein Lalb_Chr02g0156191 [Lupinus albus]
MRVITLHFSRSNYQFLLNKASSSYSSFSHLPFRSILPHTFYLPIISPSPVHRRS